MSTSYLSKKDQQLAQRSEAKMLKRIAGVSRRTRNTGLLNAVKVEKLRDKLDLEKIKLFMQLYRNDLTRELMEFAANNEKIAVKRGKWTNFVCEIMEICSRVRKENAEAQQEQRMTEFSMVGETTMYDRMESTTCMANQSRFVPCMEMLLMEAK